MRSHIILKIGTTKNRVFARRNLSSLLGISRIGYNKSQTEIKTIITLIIILFVSNAFSKTISFLDLELKAFLISEYCEDTNN